MRNVRRERGAPSKETELTETVKSTLVWRIAFPHVSPSMPTHVDAACEPDAPEGSLGVGTVNVAVTDLYVPCHNVGEPCTANLASRNSALTRAEL